MYFINVFVCHASFGISDVFLSSYINRQKKKKKKEIAQNLFIINKISIYKLNSAKYFIRYFPKMPP